MQNLSDLSPISADASMGVSYISCSSSYSGRGKRRNPGLIIRNRTTLMAPERRNSALVKNVTAADTWWLLNCRYRATVLGRMMREYATG